MKRISRWLWQLPQNILGLAVTMFAQVKHPGGWYECDWLPGGGICLGEYIFLRNRHTDKLLHLAGHREQSRILGPAYLFAVTFVSMGRWIYSRFIPRLNRHQWYYSGWPEKQANQLATQAKWCYWCKRCGKCNHRNYTIISEPCMFAEF